MTTRRLRDTETPDLFLSWRPKAPTLPPESDQAPESAPAGCRLAELVSRQVADALRAAEMPRDEVARRMSEELGETVSVHMLNAYASQAREDHNISHARMVALAVALERPDLLVPAVRRVGKAMIDPRYLAAVRSAIRRDRARDHRRIADEEEHLADRDDRTWRGH